VEQIHKVTHLNNSCKYSTEDLPPLCLGLNFFERGPTDVTGEEGMSLAWDLHPILMPHLNQRLSMCMCLCVHGMCKACAVITGITV